MNLRAAYRCYHLMQQEESVNGRTHSCGNFSDGRRDETSAPPHLSRRIRKFQGSQGDAGSLPPSLPPSSFLLRAAVEGRKCGRRSPEVVRQTGLRVKSLPVRLGLMLGSSSRPRTAFYKLQVQKRTKNISTLSLGYYPLLPSAPTT